jgi:cell division protein FtsQ
MPVLREPTRRSRSNRKLLALLFLFFMTVLVILFFQSSLSKITSIEIKGNEVLATDAIGQAAGIKVGDHFFGTNGSAVEKRVAAMKMVQSAHVTKRFPGVVTIEVTEYPKVAFQIGSEGKLQAVLADGSAVELQKEGAVPDRPILTGWRDDDPIRTKLCQTLEKIPPALLADISEIQPDPTSGFEDKIKMYTRSQFIVETTVTFLPDKIDRLQAIVDNLHENNVNGGVITMLLTDSHAPLDTAADSAKDSAKENDKSAQKQPAKDGKQDTKQDTKTDKSPTKNNG